MSSPANGPLDDLATAAQHSLDAGTRAGQAGDTDAAVTALRRARDLARLLTTRAPDRADGPGLQGQALYLLAGMQLDRGETTQARTALDAAESLFSQVGDAGWLADVRARRGLAHASLGRGLSAVVDVQSAVLHHVQALGCDPGDPTGRRLATALAAAAAVQSRHGGTHLALTAARQAAALLTRPDETAADPQAGTVTGAESGTARHRGPEVTGGTKAPDVTARGILAGALRVEIGMLRALDLRQQLDAPAAALERIAGPAAVRELLDAEAPAIRPGLTAAAAHPLVAPQTREAVQDLLVQPLDGASIPGFLVTPENLLDLAREGAATAVDLATQDARLALAAGLDAACLYACAEELGLIEHPWPVVRIELARWLWLLVELGWLAAGIGDVELARDLCDHAGHPLVRAESGRHLPVAIARSLADSTARLRQLRRTVG